jgi:hypothetical protein
MPRGYNLETKGTEEIRQQKKPTRMRASWIRESSENKNFAYTIKQQIEFHEKRLRELYKILQESQGH